MLSLSFAKLVATPSDTSWAQVYNAGNLFASLSLSKQVDDETSLNSVGKELFSSLESEFFTLEEKNLKNIKEALANSTHTIPASVSANLCLAYFKENFLYLFIYKAGSITMKRRSKIGMLLERKDADPTDEIIASSGILEQGDTIILQTSQFANDMTQETISSALDLSLPNDIAEVLSPAMHEKDDGGQAAIIINYKDLNQPSHNEPDEDMDTIPANTEMPEDDLTSDDYEENKDNEATIRNEPANTEITIENEELDILITDHRPSPEESEMLVTAEPQIDKNSKLSAGINYLKSFFIKKTNTIHLNHRKKFFLTIAVIILIVLATTVTLTKKREADSQTRALFASIYEPALANYEDGKGVQSINQEFARVDFIKARKQLLEGKDKFKKGSDEDKKITELLAKLDAELGGTSTGAALKPKEITLAGNHYLSVVKAQDEGLAFTKDQNSTFFITDKAIVSVAGGNKKDIIKNDSDWGKPTGLSTYQGNFYVLDPKNGVLKFTAGTDGFGKTSYLKDKPDLSTASAIAIDGSVWILLKNGTVLKYTRGVSDGFSLKGLDKQMLGASKIFTNIDTENVYVLDNGNSRIIKISKSGSFQTQYTADILKNAKDFEVSEKDGKTLILSGGKFWELPL